MNFVTIKSSYVKSRDATVIHPTFAVSKKVDNLLCKGKAFYALWDEKNNRWSTDEYDVQRLVDNDIKTATDKVKH